MRHQDWMSHDERTPLQKKQDQMRFLQDEERRLLGELGTVRERIGNLSLEICGLVPAT